MTITEAIKQWLYEFPNIEVNERINTEVLPAEAIAYALARNPNNQVSTFADGSQLHDDYYTFFIRQYSQLQSELKSNDEFIEELQEWIAEREYDGNYPVLDNNRVCEGIEVSGSAYLFQLEEAQAIYSLTIHITYRKEID